MKLAAWNVNSLKVRLPHVLDWLQKEAPDVVCLQETKLEDHNFPADALAAAGYKTAFSGQKTYNGVALLARAEINDIVCGNPHFDDAQKRLIAGTVNGIGCEPSPIVIATGIGASMCAASYSLFSVLSRITAQPAVLTTSTFRPCFV